MRIYPPDQISEQEIEGVLKTVRRQLSFGVSLETAIRTGLIVQFGSNEQFLKLMRALDVEARAARGIA